MMKHVVVIEVDIFRFCLYQLLMSNGSMSQIISEFSKVPGRIGQITQVRQDQGESGSHCHRKEGKCRKMDGNGQPRREVPVPGIEMTKRVVFRGTIWVKCFDR